MSEQKTIPIKNRYEIVFLYDVRDANPNGDPDDANRPRIDVETNENVVTDVRLKRTIRDYWIGRKMDVLVRPETDREGNRKSMEILATEFLASQGIQKIEKKNAGQARAKLANDLPKKYIDVRSFGAAVTLTNANYSHTGAVQFGLGRSLNKPQIQSRTITSSLSSGSEDNKKGAGAIGEYHTVDYSLIRFHGIVNEINARATSYSDQDIAKLLEGLWLGTKQMNTRSKFNHLPRLLVVIEYNEGASQIGDLDLGFTLAQNSNPKKIEEVSLLMDGFIKALKKAPASINAVNFLIDPVLGLSCDKEVVKSFKDTVVKHLPNLKVADIKIEE